MKIRTETSLCYSCGVLHPTALFPRWLAQVFRRMGYPLYPMWWLGRIWNRLAHTPHVNGSY